MRAGSMTLNVVQKSGRSTTRSTFELSYVRPNQIKLRIREPEQNGRGASDRTYALTDGKLFAYDALVHERMERKAPTAGSLSERFRGSVGPVDDLIAAMVEPPLFNSFISPFQRMGKWNVKADGALTTLWRTAGSGKTKSTTALKFESQSKRLRALTVTLPPSTLDWKISYGVAPRAIGYRPPSDAAKVNSFTERPPAPRYASTKAKAVANWAMLAYDRLRHASIQIDSGQGTSKIWISAGRLREETGQIAYVWNGTTASIRDARRRTFYSGRCGLARLLDALGAVGSRMDPLVRQIVSRQNPVRVLFMPGVTVRHVGQMTTDAVPGDILEYRARGATVSIVIRKDNGLIASMRTEVLDPQGRVATQSQRNFTYGSAGKALEPAVFKLDAPAGYKRASIASLDK